MDEEILEMRLGKPKRCFGRKSTPVSFNNSPMQPSADSLFDKLLRESQSQQMHLPQSTRTVSGTQSINRKILNWVVDSPIMLKRASSVGMESDTEEQDSPSPANSSAGFSGSDLSSLTGSSSSSLASEKTQPDESSPCLPVKTPDKVILGGTRASSRLKIKQAQQAPSLVESELSAGSSTPSLADSLNSNSTPSDRKRRSDSNTTDVRRFYGKGELKDGVCPIHSGHQFGLFTDPPSPKVCRYSSCSLYDAHLPKKLKKPVPVQYGPAKGAVKEVCERPAPVVRELWPLSRQEPRAQPRTNSPEFFQDDDDDLFSNMAGRKVQSPALMLPDVPRILAPSSIGFLNLGNTCFVNATLQVLLALPGFVDRLEKACAGQKDLPESVVLLNEIASARQRGDFDSVQNALRMYVEGLWRLDKSYSGAEQHDANEFLLRLLASLKTTLPPGPGNPVEGLFEYEMAQIHQCSQCGDVTKQVRVESSLCLPLGENSHNVDQCLEQYTEPEEREIVCEGCGCKRMTVCNRFRTLPSKLLLSLNRYSKEEKITRLITPPDVLSLKRFMESPEDAKDSDYTLAGQIIHVGSSKNSGHYICHVLCDDGKWRAYSDESIRTLSFERDIQSLADPAYIFVFSRSTAAQE